jgi:hypothetical protein
LIKYAIKRYPITYAKTRVAQNNIHLAALLRYFFVFGVGSIFEGRGVHAECRGLCGFGQLPRATGERRAGKPERAFA